jgi:hypothetical protein
LKITFSQSADAILSRHGAFQKNLQEALASLPGSCFIDGRVGRSAPDDRVVLMSQDRETITLQDYEFEETATVKRIVEQLSSPAPK